MVYYANCLSYSSKWSINQCHNLIAIFFNVAILIYDGLCYLQVWRHVSGYTYRSIHQASFNIRTTGYHEFMLNSGKQSTVEAGDVISLFTRLSDEAAVIGFDRVPCGSAVTLVNETQEMTSPLTFAVSQGCRHYSFNAIYAGNIQMVKIDIL